MSNKSFIEKLGEMPYYSLVPKLIDNALRLGIFEELKEASTSEELAKKKGWHEDNTEFFLQSLYSLDYIEKVGNGYKNTEDVNRYLVKDSKEYAGTFLLFYGQNLGGVFPDDFSDLLKNGPPSMEDLMKENMNMDFASIEKMMRLHQDGLVFVEVKELLEEIPEFKSAKKILDIGCGVGMIGLNMAELNKEAEIVLFDMPQMKDAIERSIEIKDMGERANILLGDFNKDSIGSGYDFIYSSNSVYAAKDNIDEFMTKIYEALNPGGVFFCICGSVEEDHSGPWDVVLSWMVYRMKGMDMETPKNMVKDAGLKVGFELIRKESRQLLEGNQDIDILKKP
ncbi:MAG: class I SAM-dependent methyltransferase [Tissierellia bacterium]|nr:class I SAM-dependent methyltransferase [Tissierellia bacterium]